MSLRSLRVIEFKSGVIILTDSINVMYSVLMQKLAIIYDLHEFENDLHGVPTSNLSQVNG